MQSLETNHVVHSDFTCILVKKSFQHNDENFQNRSSREDDNKITNIQ